MILTGFVRFIELHLCFLSLTTDQLSSASRYFMTIAFLRLVTKDLYDDNQSNKSDAWVQKI